MANWDGVALRQIERQQRLIEKIKEIDDAVKVHHVPCAHSVSICLKQLNTFFLVSPHTPLLGFQVFSRSPVYISA